MIISQEVQDLISSRTTAPVNVDLAVEFELAMENLALGYLMTRCPPEWVQGEGCHWGVADMCHLWRFL